MPLEKGGLCVFAGPGEAGTGWRADGGQTLRVQLARTSSWTRLSLPPGSTLGVHFAMASRTPLITRTALSLAPSETFGWSGERYGLEGATCGRATASSRDRGWSSAARKPLREHAIETKTPARLGTGVDR
jgi:hypothetical protein